MLFLLFLFEFYGLYVSIGLSPPFLAPLGFGTLAQCSKFSMKSKTVVGNLSEEPVYKPSVHRCPGANRHHFLNIHTSTCEGTCLQSGSAGSADYEWAATKELGLRI